MSDDDRPAEVGEVVGSFEFVVERTEIWPVDWAAYLDDPIYQDSDVACAAGFEDMPVPIGGLIFFSHLDPGWVQRVGIDYRRSLAAERTCSFIEPIVLGDHVTGETVVGERFTKTRSSDGTALHFVRLATEYRRNGVAAMRESVLYVTSEART